MLDCKKQNMLIVQDALSVTLPKIIGAVRIFPLPMISFSYYLPMQYCLFL